MLKKMIAILITLAMLFSISLSAFADDNGQPPEPPSGDMAPPDGGNGQPPEKPDGNPPDGAPGGDDQYAKAKYVYERVIDMTEYEVGSPDNQNICSVFINGRSVCQGYAKAAQLLLNRLGVKTTLVTGTVSAGDRPQARHAWNLTSVNGRDYFFDVTWGDSSFQQAASEEMFIIFPLPAVSASLFMR